MERSAHGYAIDICAQYSRGQLWVRFENGLATIGVSDLLRVQVGGGQIVDLKLVGTRLSRGEELAGWETAKAILSLPTPIAGTIVQVNELLAAHPDLSCIAPYSKGWIAKLAPSDWDSDRAYLLGVEEYIALFKSGAM